MGQHTAGSTKKTDSSAYRSLIETIPPYPAVRCSDDEAEDLVDKTSGAQATRPTMMTTSMTTTPSTTAARSKTSSQKTPLGKQVCVRRALL